jgi:hypothetical protein
MMCRCIFKVGEVCKGDEGNIVSSPLHLEHQTMQGSQETTEKLQEGHLLGKRTSACAENVTQHNPAVLFMCETNSYHIFDVLSLMRQLSGPSDHVIESRNFTKDVYAPFGADTALWSTRAKKCTTWGDS